WQVTAVPSQRSSVHALPSSGQAVPAGCTVSAGQTGPFPGQSSALSQTPAGARHWVVDGAKRSAGQAALVPSQLSATSQALVALRHIAPAFPAGCRQIVLVPSHTSRVQTLPSSVHGVPAALLASAGQVVLVPVQVSATSHSPAASRQTVVADRNVQLAEQQGPPSHCSPASTIPLPQPQVLPLPPQTPHLSSVLPLFGRWSQPHV